MSFIWAFIVGGLLCVIGQILIDRTKLTPGKIMVIYVVSGVVLTALGIYEKIVDFAGAGAAVPIIGYGRLLANGVSEAVDEKGLLGALSGGFAACGASLAAAVIFGLIASVMFKRKGKE